MRRIVFCLFLFLLSTFISQVTFAQNFAKPFVLVIDPGHGGTDAGAVRGIFKEADITLQVAQRIRSLLQKEPSQNVEVILTRETNKSLSLENRVRTAENKKADLFISLHANSSNASYVSGMEFYFKKGVYPARLPDIQASTTVKKIIGDITRFGQVRQSLKFNQLLQAQIKTSISDQKTVIKRAPFFVIEKTTMPSALIEIGYISNLSEAKLLLTEERQQEIAETIVRSIYDYQAQTMTR